MNFWDWLIGRRAQQGYVAQAGTTLSGRPTYASGLGTLATVPRQESFRLLGQFYGNIPALKRSVSILSGMVGCPEFVCATEAQTNELNLWARTVPFGHVGMGMEAFLRDHVNQALVYGFGVGEVELTQPGNDVARLWSYRSPAFGFRADEYGALQILQQSNARGLLTLNPETAIVSAHDSQGCDPNGESLFMAIPTVAQCWLDILNQYRETWRRCGSPSFHVNWKPDAKFNDPQGTLGETVISALQTKWFAMMKSKVIDGKTKDFFSTGEITVTTIGADGQVLDIEMAKRAIVEEIVVATGIPPWMLGYTWSTTERLSTQQADQLLGYVQMLRAETEGAIQKTVELRQRMGAKRGGFAVVWPEINLQDAVELARAELMRENAAKAKQQKLRQLWADGVINQEQYAEEMTGSPQVDTPMELPAATLGGGGGSAGNPDAAMAVAA